MKAMKRSKLSVLAVSIVFPVVLVFAGRTDSFNFKFVCGSGSRDVYKYLVLMMSKYKRKIIAFEQSQNTGPHSRPVEVMARLARRWMKERVI